jgi:hypothetical protein
MKERDQAENNLKAQWVDTKLCLNNWLQNCPLAVDDALEKYGLDSLHTGPVCL